MVELSAVFIGSITIKVSADKKSFQQEHVDNAAQIYNQQFRTEGMQSLRGWVESHRGWRQLNMHHLEAVSTIPPLLVNFFLQETANQFAHKP